MIATNPGAALTLRRMVDSGLRACTLCCDNHRMKRRLPDEAQLELDDCVIGVGIDAAAAIGAASRRRTRGAP